MTRNKRDANASTLQDPKERKLHIRKRITRTRILLGCAVAATVVLVRRLRSKPTRLPAEPPNMQGTFDFTPEQGGMLNVFREQVGQMRMSDGLGRYLVENSGSGRPKEKLPGENLTC